MKKFIDISDRKELNDHLSKLKPGTIPVWGSFTAQQMLEHLVLTVEYTNGKKQTGCTLAKEDAEKRKQFMIYSDVEMPMGIKTPVKKGDPAATTFTSMEAAITALNKELDDFEKYFKTEGITSVHPGFGELTYHEWLVFHGKHFTHHFKQFGIFT